METKIQLRQSQTGGFPFHISELAQKTGLKFRLKFNDFAGFMDCLKTFLRDFPTSQDFPTLRLIFR